MVNLAPRENRSTRLPQIETLPAIKENREADPGTQLDYDVDFRRKSQHSCESDRKPHEMNRNEQTRVVLEVSVVHCRPCTEASLSNRNLASFCGALLL
jgi:hypothetical protein